MKNLMKSISVVLVMGLITTTSSNANAMNVEIQEIAMNGDPVTKSRENGKTILTATAPCTIHVYTPDGRGGNTSASFKVRKGGSVSVADNQSYKVVKSQTVTFSGF